MRVIIKKPFDYVTKRNSSGSPLATVAYKPNAEPLTVKREHGEAMVKAGAATEVKEPAKRHENSAATMKALRAAVGADGD